MPLLGLCDARRCLNLSGHINTTHNPKSPAGHDRNNQLMIRTRCSRGPHPDWPTDSSHISSMGTAIVFHTMQWMMRAGISIGCASDNHCHQAPSYHMIGHFGAGGLAAIGRPPSKQSSFFCVAVGGTCSGTFGGTQ